MKIGIRKNFANGDYSIECSCIKLLLYEVTLRYLYDEIFRQNFRIYVKRFLGPWLFPQASFLFFFHKAKQRKLFHLRTKGRGGGFPTTGWPAVRPFGFLKGYCGKIICQTNLAKKRIWNVRALRIFKRIFIKCNFSLRILYI